MRAAAILIIVTGLNDVIAGEVPLYEPLYLYLAAIALVVWLDGVILGALTAIGAIAFYALLFMPRAAALSTALLVPAGEAFATVLLVGIAAIAGSSRYSAPVAHTPMPTVPTQCATPVALRHIESTSGSPAATLSVT